MSNANPPVRKTVTVKFPTLLEMLEGYGIATGEAQARLDRLKARFPAGAIPITEVNSIINGLLTPGVIDKVITKLWETLNAGKGTIKDDPSSLA